MQISNCPKELITLQIMSQVLRVSRTGAERTEVREHRKRRNKSEIGQKLGSYADFFNKLLLCLSLADFN